MERAGGNSVARQRLYSDILADNLPKKTIHHYLKTYNRLFNEFLSLKFPQIISFNQLSLPFFKEYKNYYVNDIGRPNGWRVETTKMK